MRNLQHLLTERLREALPGTDKELAVVQACQDTKFGDYQTSIAMILGKKQRVAPRSIAEDLIPRLNMEDLCEPPGIAGAGFINFKLKSDFVRAELGVDDLFGWAEGRPSEDFAGRRLSKEPRAQPLSIVIDFSSPNIAKEMHVGHIRSTILGDSMARIHRFLGNRVITDNHLGDWGTQFGMLLYGYKNFKDDEALAADPLAELERLYKTASELAAKDEQVRDACREELARLQRGDPERIELWKKFTTISWKAFCAIYDRLGVKFDEHLGESFYNDKVEDIVLDLQKKGIAREDQGAICVFFPEGEGFPPEPVIIRKKDGATLYATSDLAAIRYRIQRWNPDEIIYVTDSRQQLHFRQIFWIASKWLPTVDWAAKLPLLSHVWFGSILGEDRKPIKTRSGAPIKLVDLITEAESRAFNLVTEKSPELPEEDRRGIARAVGIGAVKYGDLAQDRVRDYVFDWDKLLAFKGNTAPYLMYAVVRIESIYRKGQVHGSTFKIQDLREPAEIDLAKELLKFPEIVQLAADDHRPHHLCFYLFRIAEKFSSFYEACPVLQSEGKVRESRLALCRKTADVLKQGLYLLGMETLERM